jgi:hypothetical protein
MEILVFSDDPRCQKIFSSAVKAKAAPLRFLPCRDLPENAELPAAAGKAPGPVLFYVDINSCPKKRFLALRRALAGKAGLRYAVVDAAGEVEDVAAALQEGALDYLGPKLCRTGVTAARLKSVLAALKKISPADDGIENAARRASPAEAGATPARDWDRVQSGGEYLFHMMYIELDGHKDVGLRSSEATLGKLIAYFQKAVERATAAVKGRLWIWTDFSGIVLFPAAVAVDEVAAACLRLMLSRRILSVGQDIQKLLFCYRIVLLDGSTVYRERGKTDRIISDSVNSLSHLGAKFAKPGNFYLAKELFEKLSPGLKKCFTAAGTFERTALYKMKLPARY